MELPMAREIQNPSESESRKLRLDLDVRLTGKGLVITRAQIVAMLAALAAAIWTALHFR
jgi:hypothetical protein